MQFVCGARESVADVIALASPYNRRGSSSRAALRSAYLEYLRQHHGTIGSGGSELPEIITEPGQVERIADLMELSVDSARSAGSNGGQSQDWRAEVVRDGLAQYRAIPDACGALLDLTVTRIVVPAADVPAGSLSVSSLVGTIAIVPAPSWRGQEVVEALHHELTHTLLFLDQSRFGHYVNPNAMRDERLWARSALRGERRPVDAVFHSIVVAAEISELRSRHLGHPDDPQLHPASSELTESGRAAIESLHEVLAKEPLLDRRAMQILESAEASLQQVPGR